MLEEPEDVLVPAPSSGGGGNYGKTADKNFTLHNDTLDVVAMPTESDHPVSPAMVSNHVVGDHPIPPTHQPDDVEAGSQRTCSYTGKGVCTIHGPGDNRTWKPRVERVTSQDGVTITR